MIYFFIIRLLFLETFVLALPLQATRRAEEADPNASDGNLLIRHSQAPGPTDSFPAVYEPIGQTTGFATQLPHPPSRPNFPQASPVTTGQTTVDPLSIPFGNLQIGQSSSNVDGSSGSSRQRPSQSGPVRNRKTRRRKGQPYAGTSHPRPPLQVGTIPLSQAHAWSHPTRRKMCDPCVFGNLDSCKIPSKPEETETEFIRPDSEYEKCTNCKLVDQCVLSLQKTEKLAADGKEMRRLTGGVNRPRKIQKKLTN